MEKLPLWRAAALVYGNNEQTETEQIHELYGESCSEEYLSSDEVISEIFTGEITNASSENLEIIESSKTYQQVVEEEQYSVISSIFEYVVWPFSSMYGALSSIFYDGKHPCKQAKYACVLQEIKNKIPQHVKNLVLDEPHCLTPLQKDLQNIIRILSEFSDDKRTKHQNFLQLYRKALTSKAYNENHIYSDCHDVNDLHAIANAIYNVRLYSFLASVICGVIQKGSMSDSSFDIMDLPLIEQREAIRNLPQADKAPLLVLWYNCMKGHFGIWFDPHIMGNIPHILFDLQNFDQKTRFIRTGTPTIDEKNPNSTWGFRTRIAPEFLAYIRFCHEKNKKILYFNLQEAIGGAESYRSQLLKDTFENEGLADSIFMLDHGTSYYNQSHKWKDFDNTAKFKQSFIDHLIRNPSFWIPEKLQYDDKFLKQLRTMMDHIHEDVFFGEEILDQKERQDFLDIAYSHLILECVQYLKPDVVITCCKDALDRSGVRTFILMYLLMIYTNHLEREDKLNLMITTFGPPFLMKKQELIDERFERLNRCHMRLSQERVKENLLARATSNGLRDSVEILMHALEEQVFDMKEGAFETELEQ